MKRSDRVVARLAVMLAAAGLAGLVAVPPATATPGPAGPSQHVTEASQRVTEASKHLAAGPQYAAATPELSVEHVIVVGVAGLRWDDVSRDTAPALWRLADGASIGALSVRAVGALTCPADGWVTLGAGNRSRGPVRPGGGVCPDAFPIAEPVAASSGGGARLPDQPDLVARNETLAFGSRPGALADSLSCVTAIGREAAVAAAHPSGRIDRYASALPGNPGPLFDACPVSVIGLDTVDGSTPAQRRADVARVDAAIAAVEADRPASSLLMVVGLADAGEPPRLHVAVVDGPGFDRSWLTSPSTRREPYTQLIDVAPTALAAVGRAAPPSMSGQVMRAGGARPQLAAAVDDLVDADRAAHAQRPLVQPFLTSVVVLNLGLIALATVLFRWRARRAQALAPRPVPFGLSPRRLVELAAIAIAGLLPASFIANAVPWWRLPAAGLLYLVSIAVFTAGIAALAVAGPWGRSRLGPPACVALIAAVVLGLDVIVGSPLQLNALAGYSPLVAGRFIGFGNLAFAVFAAGALLATGYLVQRLRGRVRTAALIATGVLAVLIVGVPGWGADVGGIIALAPAFAVLALRASGIRLSLISSAAAGGLGLAAVSLFALLDYSRAPEDRTHLGRFVAQLSDGSAAVVLRRKAEANLSLLVDSQLTLLVLAVLVFIPLVLMRRSGGLRRVFGLFPSVRAAMLATVVAAALGFAVNDSGIAVPAFFAALAVPLAIATTIRTIAGAHRTVPATVATGGAGFGDGDPVAARPGAARETGADSTGGGQMQPVGSPPAGRQEDEDR